MISKQVLLGTVLALGGAVVFFSMVNNEPSEQGESTHIATTQTSKPVVQPLTADVATEEKLLAKKQQERQEYELQVQKQTELLLAEQEKARLNALDKADLETNKKRAEVNISAESASKSEMVAIPTIQTRPEAIEAAKQAEEKRLAEESKRLEQDKKQEKTDTSDNKKTSASKQDEQKRSQATKPAGVETKTESKKTDEKKSRASLSDYEIKTGETWTSIAKKHGVSVAALTQANGMGRNDTLYAGRTIKIPTSSQKTEDKRVKDSRSNETKNTESKARNNGENKSEKASKTAKYSVQVAISPDRAKVDELVEQYRAAGYQVSTSNTTRGIRVLVGGEQDEAAAKALRSKIIKDDRVKSAGAWVHKTQ